MEANGEPEKLKRGLLVQERKKVFESKLHYMEVKFECALSSRARQHRRNMQGIFYSYTLPHLILPFPH